MLQMATWEGNMTMGGTFDLEWRRAYGLRWEDVQHLHNPLNEGKPVKISRDGQELPADLGHTLLVMIEEGADRENIPPPPVPGMLPLVCHSRLCYAHVRSNLLGPSQQHSHAALDCCSSCSAPCRTCA